MKDNTDLEKLNEISKTCDKLQEQMHDKHGEWQLERDISALQLEVFDHHNDLSKSHDYNNHVEDSDVFEEPISKYQQEQNLKLDYKL